MIGTRDQGRCPQVLAMSNGAVAGLTIGISVYAAAILIAVGLGISAARQGRRRTAIACAVVVGVLTVAGVIVAVASSVA
ncbi:hypothetical protein GOPIP_094_00050 [Gordonia polyisoprenivorans NBRC 16320 = JCM 10675]|nr:hypothetical protein [Gordonia polyisoprenivorans]MBE7191387.1 hypothetical protein [Gordonia polyisoprenivorans]NKY01380.1 hypothetical protein [Gordonia polyisoprenivorans]OZC29650.1 hypothetical protein CJJ17_23460 [Gordonia polyisoprenivorans]UZF57974.1 hypothetical protein LH935_08375 [Gordonia polyisoprenivorans]WCB39011.1 hypothetical protein PHA63_07840 [Gordonia polyisoprenivorans]